MTPPNSSPFIHLEIPQFSQVINLLTVEDAIDWVNQELERWQWLSSASSSISTLEPHTTDRAHRLRAALNNLGNTVAATRNAPTDAHNAEQLINALKVLYVDIGLPKGDSDLGHFLAEYHKKYLDIRSISAVMSILVPNTNGNHSSQIDVMLGVADATLHVRGLTQDIKSFSDAFSEQLSRWDNMLTDLHTSKSADLESILARISENHSHQQQTYGQYHSDWVAFRKQSDDELKALKETYNEHMSLAAPITYWSVRKRYHRCMAWFWGSFFLSSLLAGAAGTIFMSFYLLGLHDLIPDAIAPTTQVSINQYWERLATVGVIFTFTAWLLKVLSRLWLSNLHLATDADERVTMVKTYLAMLKRKTGIKDEDRSLVLAAIFRPCSTGLLKVDPIAHALLDPLGQLGKSQ